MILNSEKSSYALKKIRFQLITLIWISMTFLACGEQNGPSLLRLNTDKLGHHSEISDPSLSYSNTIGTRGLPLSITPTAAASSRATIPGLGAYSLDTGTLPAGLTFDPNTGIISGTPTALQTSISYKVRMTDSEGRSVLSSSFTISVTENWIDNSNLSIGFQGGTVSGVSWDSTNSFMRITQTGSTINDSGMDSNWTPQWSEMVGYWKMDNDWADSTSNGNNGTTVGSPTFSSDGKVGAASGVFDGASYVSIPDSNSLDFEDEFTVMTWIYISSSTQNFWLFSKNAPGFSTGYGIAFEHPTGKIWPHLGIGGSLRNPKSTGATAYGQWNQIVVTYDGTNIKIFINGQLDSTIAQSGTFGTNSSNLWIGNSPGSPGEYLNGKIDDFAIWKKALTFSEIKLIYDRQLSKYGGSFQSRVFDNQASSSWTGLKWITTLPFGKELTGDADNSGTITASDSETTSDYSSLTSNTLMNSIEGLWHLNESAATGGANNDFADSSGHSRNGEASGGVTFGGTGIFSHAAQFAASGSGAITISNFPDLTNQMTLQTWIYPSSTPGSGNVYTWFAKGKSGTSNDSNFYFDYRYQDGAPRLVAGWTQPAGTPIEYYNSTTLPLYAWSHVLWTIDWSTSPNTVKLYVNGTNKALTLSGSSTATPSTTSTQVTTLGSLHSGSKYLDGYLDEVAVWSRVLSETEGLQLYRRGSNRIKFQIRACTSSTCADAPPWYGPDGTSGAYFTELNNYKNNDYLTRNCSAANLILTSSPDLWFQCLTDFTSAFPSNRQYIQYKAIFESEDSGTACNYGSGAVWCSPELRVVQIRP